MDIEGCIKLSIQVKLIAQAHISRSEYKDMVLYIYGSFISHAYQDMLWHL